MKAEHNFDLIGYFNRKITLLEEDGRNVILHQFDDQLKVLGSPSITVDNHKARLFGYVPQDSLLSLYYKYTEDGQYLISVVNYDSRLNLAGKTILRAYPRNQVRPLTVSVSRDHACHLITLEESQERANRYIMYHAPTNTILWQQQDPLADEKIFEEDRRGRIVTNDGLYLSLYVRGHNRLKNDYSLLVIDQNGFKQTTLKLSDVPLTDIRLNYDNHLKQIIVTGIYLDQNLTAQEGILLIRLSDDLNYIGEVKKIPFTTQTIVDYLGQRQRSGAGMTDIYINGVIERKDGGILILCEQKKEISRVNNTARSAFVPMSTSIDYYVEDIVLTSLSVGGNLEWQKLLQKKQYSYDDNAVYSSYFIHANPSQLRLLYNDEIKNENTISEYVVNALGNVDRRVLFNTVGSEIHLQIRNSVQIDANSSILPSIRKGKLRLVKITY